MRFVLFVLLFCFYYQGVAQEWKNMRLYRKQTHNEQLSSGNWLRKDRKRQNKRWHNANVYNLSGCNGYLKYRSIEEVRDFYLWFDSQRLEQGHEIRWIGLAAIASGQLAKVDRGLLRVLFVRDCSIVNFARSGSEKVFAFAFPLLKDIYFSESKIVGQRALDWEIEYGRREQCVVLDSLYQLLPEKSLKKLERMAKGKGIFFFGVPLKLHFEGEIDNCEMRFQHSITKLLPYYLAKSSRRWRK